MQNKILFICQALLAILSALRFIMGIVEAVLPASQQGAERAEKRRALVQVSASRARVLCPKCLGENDELFHHCQWCAQAFSDMGAHSQSSPLELDEVAIGKRYSQFQTALVAKASMKSRSSTMDLFSKFLASRRTGRSVSIAEAQPQDVVEYACWLDSCGKRRRTIVHAQDCQAVGTSNLSGCSTEKGECDRRYAHDSLRSNHISKLAVVFEKELP